MMIFLYGEDTYRSRQKLKEIVERYKKIHKNGLNLIYLDAQNLKFADFKDIFRQAPMFSEKKLIILSNFFANQNFKEEILKNIDSFLSSKDVLLFFQEGKISENDRFLKYFKKENIKIQEFKFLTGEKLKNWAKKEISGFGAEIGPPALSKIIEFIGSDLWRFSNEIKKLTNYSKEISVENAELLVKPDVEAAIFKTIDAVARKDKKEALLSVRLHLDKGDSPLYLFSMINFQFRNILAVKDLLEKNMPYYSILKVTRLHPFVVKKSCQQAGKFTFQELKKIFQKIFQADLDIKTGRINPETALDLLIAGI